VIKEVLSRLFTQYDDGKRLTFGSRFMTYVGNRLLGTLEENGVVVSPDIARDYYNIKEDRFLPASTDKNVLAAWKRDSVLVCQVRQMTAPRISLSVSIISMAAVLVIVGAAGVARLTTTAALDAAAQLGLGDSDKRLQERCDQLGKDIYARRVDPETVQDQVESCNGVVGGAK